MALLMLPFIAALALWPITANLAIRKAEQKRLDEEVRVMLRGKGTKPRAIADEALLEAEAEAATLIKF